MTGRLTGSAEVKAYPLHSKRNFVRIGSRAGACDVPVQLLFVVEQVVLSIGGERYYVIFHIILVCNDLSFNKPKAFQLQRRQFVKLTLICIVKNVISGNSLWRERGMFEYFHKQQLLRRAKRI